MTRDQIIETIELIMEKQGKTLSGVTDETRLRDVGFRSLDFSELCIRVEDSVGRELNFDAGNLRRIETIGDVCAFLEAALRG